MVIRIINTLIEVLKMAILIEVILSWVPNGRHSKISTIIRAFTAPIMEPSEKINNRIFSGSPVDFSPIIAYFLISILQRIILTILGTI
jgi:YggT family protein